MKERQAASYEYRFNTPGIFGSLDPIQIKAIYSETDPRDFEKRIALISRIRKLPYLPSHL